MAKFQPTGVRVFTVAREMDITSNGLLTLTDGGLQGVAVERFPTLFPPVWLAVILGLPADMLNRSFRVVVELLDEDRRPIGPSPLHDASPKYEKKPDSEHFYEYPLIFRAQLNSAGLVIKEPGTVFFHLNVDGRSVGVLPFTFWQRGA